MTPDEILAWREVRGMSQADLAEALSVDGTLAQATVSRWETGERSAPPFLRLALDKLGSTHRRTRIDASAREWMLTRIDKTLEVLYEGRLGLVANWTEPGKLRDDLDDLVGVVPEGLMEKTFDLERQIHLCVTKKPPNVGGAQAALLAMQRRWR